MQCNEEVFSENGFEDEILKNGLQIVDYRKIL